MDLQRNKTSVHIVTSVGYSIEYYDARNNIYKVNGKVIVSSDKQGGRASVVRTADLVGLQQKPLTPANEAELLTISPRLVTCHELLMRNQ